MVTRELGEVWTTSVVDASLKAGSFVVASLALYAAITGLVTFVTGILVSIIVASLLLIVAGTSYSTLLNRFFRYAGLDVQI